MSGPESPLNAPKPVPVWNPNTPIRAGRVLTAEQLTPMERTLLQAMGGYDGTSAVPEDLGSRLSEAVDPRELAAERERLFLEAAKAMPPAPVVMPVGLDADKVATKQLDKLPPDLMATMRAKMEEQQRFRDSMLQKQAPPVATAPVASTQVMPQVASAAIGAPQNMRDLMERLRAEGVADADKAGAVDSMHPAIAQAFQQLDQVPVAPPAPAEAPQPSEAAQTQPPVAPPLPLGEQTREQIIAYRKDQRDKELKRLDASDLNDYRSAVMLGVPYSKTYTCFDGGVEFTFGDTYGDDYDAVMQQANADRFNRRVSDDMDERTEVMRWYMLAVTLRKVYCAGTTPGSDGVTQYEISDAKPLVHQISKDAAAMVPGFGLAPGDTPIRIWAEYMKQHVATGSMRQLLLTALRKFQLHLLALQFVCQDPESF